MTLKGTCERCGRTKAVHFRPRIGPLPASTVCSSCAAALRPQEREQLREFMWGDAAAPASDEKFYPRFTTLDTTAHETGTIHMVNVPDDLLAERDPRSLQGETVLLDGVLVQVEGIETHAVVWYPGNMRLKTIGLLVVPGT